MHRRTRSRRGRRRGRMRGSVGVQFMPRTRWHAPASLYTWYRVQQCGKCVEASKCEKRRDDNAALKYFREAMKDGRRILPKDVEQLKTCDTRFASRNHAQNEVPSKPPVALCGVVTGLLGGSRRDATPLSRLTSRTQSLLESSTKTERDGQACSSTSPQ